MANIRVTCPACKSELEIDEAFGGKEVECGNCLEVFVARAPGAGDSGKSGPGKIPGAGASGRSKPADKPAPKRRRDDDDDDDRDRRRRRRDDDDDDDDYGPPPPRRSGSGPGDGAATAALVLGILSLVLVCCWPISGPTSLAAIVTGIIGLQSREKKGLAVAGLILGVISLGLLGLLFLIGLGNAIVNGNALIIPWR
jgi:predicted Zn finger-like uncharacterized protein